MVGWLVDCRMVVATLTVTPGLWSPGAAGILVRLLPQLSLQQPASRIAVKREQPDGLSLPCWRQDAKVKISVSTSQWCQPGTGLACIDGCDLLNSQRISEEHGPLEALSAGPPVRGYALTSC